MRFYVTTLSIITSRKAAPSMNILVEFILKYVKKYNSVSESEEEIYRYGIDVVVYTVLSTLGLLLIGLCWGRLSETALIVGIYYLNQTIGGGYHARSHIGCFLSIPVQFYLLSVLGFLVSDYPNRYFAFSTIHSSITRKTYYFVRSNPLRHLLFFLSQMQDSTDYPSVSPHLNLRFRE